MRMSFLIKDALTRQQLEHQKFFLRSKILLSIPSGQEFESAQRKTDFSPGCLFRGPRAIRRFVPEFSFRIHLYLYFGQNLTIKLFLKWVLLIFLENPSALAANPHWSLATVYLSSHSPSILARDFNWSTTQGERGSLKIHFCLLVLS